MQTNSSRSTISEHSISRSSSTATMESQYTETATIGYANFDAINRNVTTDTFIKYQKPNQVSPDASMNLFANEHQALTLKQKILKAFCCR